jgi:sulfur carrier protein
MLVNGKELSISSLSQKNIPAILDFYGIQVGTVAIEKNGEIIPEDSFYNESLEESDRLEIIKFVGGG